MVVQVAEVGYPLEMEQTLVELVIHHQLCHHKEIMVEQQLEVVELH
jgi:hypothetical protein